MALPLFGGNGRRRENLVAIDLGGRRTKAVEMQHRGGKFTLSRYCVLDSPDSDKPLDVAGWSEHIKSVHQSLGAVTKNVSVALDINNSLVRHADMPPMPIGDMRQVLKTNAKTYLQQELPDHVYDCFITAPSSDSKAEKKPAGPPRVKVIVAGARQAIVNDIHTAIRQAGLVAESLVPSLIGPVNAFERAMPEVFAKEAVALVDFGFRNTSICLLQEGQLILSRVVAIGGHRLTQGLAESMGISYAEAESIKVGLPAEVQSTLEPLILPLGRELRASIDYFEHQQDRPVTQVFISGGSARSEFLVNTLQAEIMLECKAWNPISFAELSLPAEQAGTVEQVSPELTVAVGTALATL